MHEFDLLAPAEVDGKSRLSKAAADAIRECILVNRFQPGDPLAEKRLAEQLKMSRTPIREALRQLESEGLVRIMPGRGAFVAPISIQDLKEISDLRKALECLAARTAVFRVPTSEIDRYEKRWLQVSEVLNQGGQVPWEELSGLDNEMHSLILEYCDNSRLKAIARILNSHIARYQSLAARSLANARTTTQQHLEILSIMRERQADRLADALARHIELSQHYILERYLKP
ncbi:MAG: GntR family transcriptional regulator [Ignavibacteriales bacterium]